MALTRKFLSALGIEAEKVDEIINAHTETVDALKMDRDRYKEDAEKLPKVQEELDSIKKASEGLDGKNPFEVKYNAIKEEFDQFKAEVQAKETTAKKTEAYKALLKEAGVAEKRIEAVLRVSDIDGVKLDRDGKVEGADELLKAIKTEWADFIPTESTTGAATANPPKNTGGSSKSKEEILAIKDASERQKAIAENINLWKG